MQDTYTQKDLLESGWTKTLIKNFLPAPELKDNPIYRSAPKMKIWRREDVEKAMKSKDYQEAKAKADKRRKASQKAIDTKNAKLEIWIQEKLSAVQIKVIAYEDLRRRTISAKQNWYNYQTDLRNNFEYRNTAMDADDGTIKRWMVNFVRHNLTKYDETLFQMRGKVGKKEKYLQYRDGVLSKIAEAYPYLANECQRQIDAAHAELRNI